ncbi:hypothetical protein Tco_0939716, partial [Tanacetum coccineum]
VSNPNPIGVLNSVENDVNLGTNGETSNLARKEANSGESLSSKLGSSSTSATSIVEKIDKHERLIIDGKDGVESVDNEMASFLASKRVNYGTNSLLKQWMETYENVD